MNEENTDKQPNHAATQGRTASTCYAVVLTREQMKTISKACDLLCRLGLGQMEDALYAMPSLNKVDWSKWHDSIDLVKKEMCQHMEPGADSVNGSLGISNDRVPYPAKVACDIHQTIRRQLSWENAVNDGVIESMDSPRKWPEMMQVNYDEPMTYSDQPLPEISLHNV